MKEELVIKALLLDSLQNKKDKFVVLINIAIVIISLTHAKTFIRVLQHKNQAKRHLEFLQALILLAQKKC
jgi:hypothetical protein